MSDSIFMADVQATAPLSTGEVGMSDGARQARDAHLGLLRAHLPGLNRIFNPVAQLRICERLMLYSIVYAEKPRNCLEIGTCNGGSALILCGAMDDNGFGRLVCVDQRFQISEPVMRLIEPRVRLVEGTTPDVLPRAAEAAGAPFDLAFIDGDHSADGVYRDAAGTLPLLSPRATLLFHDSHYHEVRAGIDRLVRDHAESLTDCGELTLEETALEVPGWGVNLWGGIRMLRCGGFAEHRR
ncbi:MAG: class I SAM-dependent methyltransferase [Planctomycetes bacterium]|nr:class I SAM-dependent methyltransferase [Planctomycetota bacterium]